MQQLAEVSEVGNPLHIEGASNPVRVCRLTLHDATIEVCSIGASISKILLPKAEGSDDNTDDIVLGYASPKHMFECDNPEYFGVVVGRVANRIAKGKFQLDGVDYSLAINNDPNHLHGGIRGFSRCVWDMKIVDVSNEEGIFTKGVKCSLLSSDGDQGYPGTVLSEVVYSLTANSKPGHGVTLRVNMTAKLTDGKATPINLAQHTYFNLGKHNDAHGILDHKMSLSCKSYTPVDATSIPTRKVVDVKNDPAMDLTTGKTLRESLVFYGTAKAGLSEEEAVKHTNAAIRTGSSIAKSGSSCATPGEPYGFDHNYVVPTEPDASALTLVATVAHEASRREMKVYTNAPGVQVYTANYLDGADPKFCKDGAVYGQWQGFCLETQSFPDAILSSEEEAQYPSFSKGKCHILRPGNPYYEHTVAYSFETLEVASKTNNNTVLQLVGVVGSGGTDSHGNKFPSVESMWSAQGIIKGSSSKEIIREIWYDKAANWYEENCPPTVDGVLGGFASISDMDLAGSKAFLKVLQEQQPSLDWSKGAGCECGAGIGRVTKGLLLDLNVTQVDVVEASERLLCESPEYIGDGASKCRFYCKGLQDWSPPSRRYSIIWIQWVLCYLTDDDVVAFLKRCSEGLLVDGKGVIILKENTCGEENFVVDTDDASVCRSLPYWLKLVEAAGLRVVMQHMQDDFPSEIFPVPMLAICKQ